jgi:predicted nucleic acid-binding protein
MAGRLLLDTDVLIEYSGVGRRRYEYLEGLTSDLFISVVSVAELFAGAKGDEEE